MSVLNKCTWLTGIGLILLMSACRPTTTEPVAPKGATHRVVAKTKLYLYDRPLGTSIPLDTLVVTDQTYFVSGVDSTRFTYDQLDRVLKIEHQQTSQGDAHPSMGYPPYQRKSQSTFSYQNRRLTEIREQSTKSRSVIGLDPSSRRIEFMQVRNQSGELQYVETSHRYSSEGILEYRRRTGYTKGLTPMVEEERSTIENGNLVQTTKTLIESYSPPNTVYEIIDYEYDLSRASAPAVYTFEGETSRNALLKKTISRPTSKGGDRYEFTYHNEYDQQGRLVLQVEYLRTNDAPDREINNLTRYYYN